MKILFFLCLILLSLSRTNFAQVDSSDEGTVYTFAPDTSVQNNTADTTDTESESDTVEIYIIDNFILPDHHNLLVLSFYTSEPAKSKVVFNNGKEVVISKELSESHKDTIDIAALNLKTKTPYFNIVVEDSAGRKYTSERNDLEIPTDVNIKGESNFLMLCLFGGTVFILPSPVYAYWNGTNYFGLTKEIPLVFLRSGGYNYPAGYFSFEYTYLWHAPVRSFIRFGYKHIFETPGIEYISPGITAVSNLHGYNGFSTELSFGLFKIFDVFTVYTKFRYTVKPGDTKSEIKDISLGLYSGFFAIYF